VSGGSNGQVPAPAELVILDCDGVLIDSERLAVEVEMALLREIGWTLTKPEVIERFVGRSDADIRRQIEEHLGHELPGDWSARLRRRYEEAFDARLVPVDGVFDALDAITLPTCVASNSGHRYLRHMLTLTGLHDRFAVRIFSAQDVARSKPAPDLFLHAARSMGVTPSRCVVVEDSPPGVEAARAAGMHVLAFAGGLMPAEFLDGPGTTVFDQMHELPRLVQA
jgi:HAD superfamily hydrolase (TIGR01509 family)